MRRKGAEEVRACDCAQRLNDLMDRISKMRQLNDGGSLSGKLINISLARRMADKEKQTLHESNCNCEAAMAIERIVDILASSPKKQPPFFATLKEKFKRRWSCCR